MKKTSQLPKDDSLMENRDTLAYGEQTTDKIPERNEDMAEGPDEDPVTMPGEDDMDTETDIEDDGTPVLTEDDLEENDLSDEEADEIEWEDKKD